MKILHCLLATLILSSALNAQTIRLSEPVQQTETTETFGAPMYVLPALSQLGDLLKTPDNHQGKSVALAVTVSKVCQAKGCFFIAQQDEHLIRVAFKDYGFFVPTNINDREVTLLGKLAERKISAAEAEHLSADLGEKGSIQSGTLYEIIATSVRVSRSANKTHSITNSDSAAL